MNGQLKLSTLQQLSQHITPFRHKGTYLLGTDISHSIFQARMKENVFGVCKFDPSERITCPSKGVDHFLTDSKLCLVCP